MILCFLLVLSWYLPLLGDKRLGLHLGDGVGVQEVFMMELALFPQCTRQGGLRISWIPEAWGIDVRPCVLMSGCWTEQVLSSSLSFPVVFASGGWGRGSDAGGSRSR